MTTVEMKERTIELQKQISKLIEKGKKNDYDESREEELLKKKRELR